MSGRSSGDRRSTVCSVTSVDSDPLLRGIVLCRAK